MSRKNNPQAEKSFGARLRELRKKNNLSGTELANILEISQGSLSEIETGKTKPSFKTIENIIKKTDIDLFWLLTGTRKKEIDQPPGAISTPFLAELETWAKEISGQNDLAWLEKQLEECLPTFKMWRERKKAEENNQNQQVA